MMRLQKYLAMCGVASRRRAEELILDGRVEVNGVVADVLGTKVDEEVDE
ncbi:pseudouridine synthase, partial [Patescibacteria group bacterium]|nr:pseudouridine synthase [Patescibacteria group bacterium]